MSANLVGDSSMTEDEVTVKKQDTLKSSVYVKTADGHIQQVDFEVATLWGTIYNEMQSGHGYCMNNPILLPPVIKKNFLNFVINYCRYHRVLGSVYEGTTFDDILLHMDAHSLYELIYVAHYLQLKSLIDCTYEAMVKKFDKLSSFEELYHMLHCPENVTEEEHSSWMKFFRRFFTERQKENKEKENSEKFEIVSKPRQYEDTRSIDELLAFINGGDEDSKGFQTGKKKKKNSKKRDKQKNGFSACVSSTNQSCLLKNDVEIPDEISTQDSNAFEATIHGVQSSSMANMVADKLKLSNTPDKNVTVEDDINRGDCDLTPSPGFDRALEDFARRLISKGPVIYFDSSSHEESKS
ncbi:hypothetical protein ACET3Z_029039 [Daucus carota]